MASLSSMTFESFTVPRYAAFRVSLPAFHAYVSAAGGRRSGVEEATHASKASQYLCFCTSQASKLATHASKSKSELYFFGTSKASKHSTAWRRISLNRWLTEERRGGQHIRHDD